MDVICKIALGMRDVKMFNNPYLESCREVFNRPLSHPVNIAASLFSFATDEIRALLIFMGKTFANNNPFFVLNSMLKKNVEKRKLERENSNGELQFKDFIDIFLDAEVDVSEVQFGDDSDTSRKLSEQEIVSQCLIFLLAGFDTTSNSLSYVLHFPANHFDVQQRLIDEVDSFLGENEVGDTIQVDSWTVHMDKTIWGEDAEEFLPERWLEQCSRPRSAFQSFGEGPRICLGMRLAFLEEKVALIKLLSRFTIEKTERTNPIKLVGSLPVSPDCVMVKLVRRR